MGTPNGNTSDDNGMMSGFSGMEGRLSALDAKKTKIKQWLTETVELPQYLDTFITNGFESMDFIKAIPNREELTEIGITTKGHQLRIMSAIQKLNENKKQNGVHDNDAFYGNSIDTRSNLQQRKEK